MNGAQPRFDQSRLTQQEAVENVDRSDGRDMQDHKAARLAEAQQNYQSGTSLAVQGKIDQALAYFERALSLWPDFVEAHNNLGLTLATQGKLDVQAQEDIVANVKGHSQDVTETIGKLEAAGDATAAADVAARFQAAVARFISAQGDVTTEAAAQVGVATTLMSSVHSTLDEASRLSAQTSTQVSAQNAPQSQSTAGSVDGDYFLGTGDKDR